MKLSEPYHHNNINIENQTLTFKMIEKSPKFKQTIYLKQFELITILNSIHAVMLRSHGCHFNTHVLTHKVLIEVKGFI